MSVSQLMTMSDGVKRKKKKKEIEYRDNIERQNKQIYQFTDYREDLNWESKKVSEGSSMEPVIIGALILDVHAKPSTTPISGTTVPGQVLNLGSISLSFVWLLIDFLSTIRNGKKFNSYGSSLWFFLKAGVVNDLLAPPKVWQLCVIN